MGLKTPSFTVMEFFFSKEVSMAIVRCTSGATYFCSSSSSCSLPGAVGERSSLWLQHTWCHWQIRLLAAACAMHA